MSEIHFGVRLWSQVFARNRPQESDWEAFKSLTLESEDLGFHSVWMYDHLMHSENMLRRRVSRRLYDRFHLPATRLECLATITALAAITRKIRVGSLVLSAPYRNPSVAAKALATIDVISNGRLEVGIGAGGDEAEAKAYGIKFQRAPVRIAQLREALEIMKRLWLKPKASFQGEHWLVREAECKPKPIQKPYPPITVAGTTPATIRIMAEHADRSNFPTPWSRKLVRFQSRLDLLRRFCDKLGRDFNDIEKSANLSVLLGRDKGDLAGQISRYKPSNISVEKFKESCLVGTSKDIASRISEFIDMGVTFFMLVFMDLPQMKSLEIFAEEIMKQF